MNNIDYLGVIFPFEEMFFKKYTNNVSYVGHPLFQNETLINSVKNYEDRNIDLGIFPGSRESEIKNNVYSMLDCIQKNKNENIAIFYANETSRLLLKKLLPDEYHSKLVSGKDLEKISNCKKALCASGTVTLELSILQVPMVIMYRLTYMTFLIMKALVKVKYIGLVNLILGDEIGSKPVVKEYVQPSYNDQVDIMVELNAIDNDEEYRKEIIERFKDIKMKLSIKPTKRLVDIAESYVNSNE